LHHLWPGWLWIVSLLSGPLKLPQAWNTRTFFCCCFRSGFLCSPG
jgi:hypothetical protein